jgi:hypothetical protein
MLTQDPTDIGVTVIGHIQDFRKACRKACQAEIRT